MRGLLPSLLVPTLGLTALACATGARSASTDAATVGDGVLDSGAANDVSAASDTAAPVETHDSVSDPRPPRVCRAGSAWTPGQKAFTDQSAGLRALGVTGIRLSAADLDGDGRAELSVRSHAQGVRDDPATSAGRLTWLLHNDGGLAFSDWTAASGFTVTRDGKVGRTAHVVVFGDVDNDGDLDALSGVNVNPDPKKDTGDRTEVLLNDGKGGFTLAEGGDVREAKRTWSLGGASFTDLDRDGLLDLWVGYGTLGNDTLPDRAYVGDGKGQFTDQTTLLGLMTEPWSTLALINANKVHRNTWGVTACDLNGDGAPDLLSSSYGRFFNGFWRSDGQGGRVDASVPAGVAADLEVDWRTNLNAQCYCKLVPAAADCAGTPPPPDFFGWTDPAKLRWNHPTDREPFRLGGNNFSTVCGDVDNDGDLDLLNLTIVHWDVGSTSDPTELLLNDASGSFKRPGNATTGLTRDWKGAVDWNAGDMTGALFDFDGDGRVDVYIGSSDYPGTRGFLFHQKPDGSFEPVAPADGIDHARSHGLAIADFDRDGDLDVAVGHGTSRCSGDATCHPTAEVHLFRNELGATANWLQLRLVGGPGSNRSAIGARVRVTAGGVTQTQEVGGGHGHYGIQHDLVLHFGLGAACDVEQVEVRWPDAKGTVETYGSLRANYRVTLTAGLPPAYETP